MPLFAPRRALPQQDEHAQLTSPPCPPPPASAQLGIPPPQHGMPPLQLGVPPPQLSMTEQPAWRLKHSIVAGVLCLVAVGGVIATALGYTFCIIAMGPAIALFLFWLYGRLGYKYVPYITVVYMEAGTTEGSVMEA